MEDEEIKESDGAEEEAKADEEETPAGEPMPEPVV